jgi:hypothetical protein
VPDLCFFYIKLANQTNYLGIDKSICVPLSNTLLQMLHVKLEVALSISGVNLASMLHAIPSASKIESGADTLTHGNDTELRVGQYLCCDGLNAML